MDKNQMLKPKMRGGFSDRNGISIENNIIQLYDFDERTRIQLVNCLMKSYQDVYHNLYSDQDCIQEFLRYVIGTIYSQIIDTRRNYDDDSVFKQINKTIMEDSYDNVLTVIEGVSQYWESYLSNQFNGSSFFLGRIQTHPIYEKFNAVFKAEYVGYRFIDGIIVAISDDMEIDAIKAALSSPFDDVRKHLGKANALLSNRNRPDYENSIKESITAVESLCSILCKTNKKGATLSAMLKGIEETGMTIHPALKDAFIKLYGYASDAKGIRHAGNLGGTDASFEEAKFMLVSCCAFTNYMMAIKTENK